MTPLSSIYSLLLGHAFRNISFQEILPCDGTVLGAFALEKILASNILKFYQNCSEDFLSQWQEVYEDHIVWKKLKPHAKDILLKDHN